jgi:cytosine/adenosine deaminase-related metal-dependent hydrolase
MPVIYSARWVLPIVAPPIEDGAVAIKGSTIVAVGPRAEVVANFPDTPAQDFGAAAILPGLINAHSHLELTVMRGFLEAEEDDFFAWLKKLTVARLAMTPDDLFVSAMCGAIEAARAGVTCLGDSSSVATQSMKALKQVGLRGIVYQESFGPDPKLAEENVAELRAQLSAMRELESERVRAGVSPHAPYTVSARQLELISRMALDEKLPVMMHAAESESERLLMLEGRGPFADGLKSRGIEWQAPGVSTIRYLQQYGILETKPLLAHCLNVDDHDLKIVKANEAAIAHCPKSNAKLGHGRAPLAKFIAHGIKFGLGSDSVASNNTCDILEEAGFATLLARLSEARPLGRATNADKVARNSGSTVALPHGRASDTITASDGLLAATLGGARALGLDNQIGALKEGMQADIVVVNLSGAHQQPLADPADTLIFSSSGRDVIVTMVAGQEIFRDQRITNAGQDEFRSRAQEIRTRLDSLA